MCGDRSSDGQNTGYFGTFFPLGFHPPRTHPVSKQKMKMSAGGVNNPPSHNCTLKKTNNPQSVL